MTLVPLSTVARVDSGAGFPIANQGAQGEEFPFLKVSDMNLPGNERQIVRWNNSVSEQVRKTLRAKAFPAGTVIFPKIGAAIGTNKKRQLTRPSCVDNNVMVVVPQAELLDADYLYFAFRAKNISDFASASNPPSIRKPDVENWQVPLPPLPEQRRIVDLLARAEGIVRLRREAAAKAAELIPALFIHHFGDPASNPMGWPVQMLSELVQEFRYGTSQKSGSTGVPVLRIPNVIGGGLDLEEMKLVELKQSEQERLRLLDGDLLFVRTNGNPDFVGRSAVYQRAGLDAIGMNGGDCVYASYLIRARFQQAAVSAHFVQAYLSTGHGRQLLRERAKTSAGQYNINIDGLGSLPVQCPPAELQDRFREKADSVLAIQAQQTTALAKAQSSFDALLAQAFAPT